VAAPNAIVRTLSENRTVSSFPEFMEFWSLPRFDDTKKLGHQYYWSREQAYRCSLKGLSNGAAPKKQEFGTCDFGVTLPTDARDETHDFLFRRKGRLTI
jgi:hypothetical protein